MGEEIDKKGESKVEYSVGDLLWAKIGNYPFWPCMVSYDPHEGSYYMKKKTRTGEIYVYHVQYFGKRVQHGWTVPGLIMPFEGEKAFLSKKKELIEAAKSKTSKQNVSSRYDIAPRFLETWILAVKEAEDAKELDIEERYESCVFKYDFNFKKTELKTNSTKKRKSKGNSKKENEPKRMKELYGTDNRMCKVCDKGNVDLMCSGDCCQYFHKDCLGLLYAPKDFKCIHCDKGLSTCFICKKPATTAFVCNKCKYHYHEECIAKFQCFDYEKKLCPYHVCLTCHNQKLSNKSKAAGTLVSCIRCPTSFHMSSHCMPVGSVRLSALHMICPDHFLGKNKVSPQITCNITYCSMCSDGGELVCCESCPNAYHATCIKTKEVPKGDFFCEDCEKREFLYNGMIVWSKTGNFRWWPAQIVDEANLPLNVKNMASYDGEFPVQYFGTDEYYWTHRGRVIPYAEHHKTFFRKGSSQCRLDSYFKISLEEAAEAFDQYIHEKQMHTITGKRDAYKHIKVNRAVPPAQIASLAGKSVLPCCCNPNKPYPCGESSGCLNRSMLMECHPGVCLAGERCENQKFQRRVYAKVKVIRTKNRGWGLLADQLITKGTFVIEYVGEVITHEEYRKRVVEMQERNEQNYYFLYLDSRRMIDAGPQGNLARFINHACSANCEMSKWSVNGDSRIGIFAIQDIQRGEELTFNYQSDSVRFQQKCYCGTENCQGFVGRNGEKHKQKIKSK